MRSVLKKYYFASISQVLAFTVKLVDLSNKPFLFFWYSKFIEMPIEDNTKKWSKFNVVFHRCAAGDKYGACVQIHFATA
jgi:hypothetical protein